MNLNDVMYKKLGDLGYMGTLNERMFKFFTDYAPPGPTVPPTMTEITGTVPNATGGNLQLILNDLAARVKALETPTP